MKNSTKVYLAWHRRLMWVAAASLLLWGISGALHPIMSWTGPKASKFFPPQLNTKVEALGGLQTALVAANRKSISTAKILPSKDGSVLQITREKLQPRVYFDIRTGDSLVSYDEKHAGWLASYFTGRATEEIKSIEFVSEFSSEYPWVNRLLPVYRVEYQGEAGLVAYVHTETNQLASLTNHWRSSLQSIFRALHTWNWFDNLVIARVFIVGLMMLTLLVMAGLGIGLIFGLPNRKIPNKSRYWHRKLSYFMWLPVLAWSLSGFYHLLQAEFVTSVSGLRLDKPFQLPMKVNQTQVQPEFSLGWLDDYANRPINSISVIRGDAEQLFFRASIGPENSNQQLTKQQRFKGRPAEVKAFYVDALTGVRVDEITDENRAEWLTQQHLKVGKQAILKKQLVTRFGNGYDFRNKRLPVWKVSIDDKESTQLFIDPATGILVDKNRSIDRLESWSFSFLHKWNMLNPLTGRLIRDFIIVSILVFGILFVLFGIRSKIKRRQSESRKI